MASTDTRLVDRLGLHAVRPALIDTHGALSYAALQDRAARLAAGLLRGQQDLAEARVAILAEPSRDFVAALIGVWRAGGIAVPLAVSHPSAELEYVIRDSGADVIIASDAAPPALAEAVSRTGVTAVSPDDLEIPARSLPPDTPSDRRALMVYTSGTTGRPKGVVTTHATVTAQVRALVEAWRWTSDDRALLVLPLHHVHGLINVVACALWSGATIEMPGRFDADRTWERLASGDITVFTAVPTIYYRLVEAFERAPTLQAGRADGARSVRLMMSGSAALPVKTLDRWRAITGQVLLERYGMTEIGMALSNPLDGERQPGHVGRPLPGVVVRLVDDAGDQVSDGTAGELEVRGPGVFGEYWRRPEATAEAFRDGWFRTGDVAVCQGGAYRLLGRTSVDIIKTAGFKVSALEIEDRLRDHPAVADCAAVGISDEEYGQRVCAAVELQPGATVSEEALVAWLADRLAPYKQPRHLRFVSALPRNAMGKVLKPDVAGWFE